MLHPVDEDPNILCTTVPRHAEVCDFTDRSRRLGVPRSQTKINFYVSVKSSAIGAEHVPPEGSCWSCGVTYPMFTRAAPRLQHGITKDYLRPFERFLGALSSKLLHRISSLINQIRKLKCLPRDTFRLRPIHQTLLSPSSSHFLAVQPRTGYSKLQQRSVSRHGILRIFQGPASRRKPLSTYTNDGALAATA